MPLLPISHQIQHKQAECLVACAFMVLAYLQIPITYLQLVQHLQISYGGAPFRNLRYLKQLNLSVTIQQGELANLRQHLAENKPIIVFVNTKELPHWQEATNHAVVISGI